MELTWVSEYFCSEWWIPPHTNASPITQQEVSKDTPNQAGLDKVDEEGLCFWVSNPGCLQDKENRDNEFCSVSECSIQQSTK